MKAPGSRRGSAGLMLAAALVFWGPQAAGAELNVQIQGQDFFRGRTLMQALPGMPEELTERRVKFWSEDAAYELEHLYRQNGFFRIRVGHEVRDEKGDGKSWRVVLRVSEGKRYLFGKIRIVVEEDSGAAAPVKKLEARKGEPFLEDAIWRDKRQITRVLGNAGFVRARVEDDVRILDAENAADVTYRVRRGRAVVFDTLLFSVRRAPPADSLEGLTREGLLRSLVPYRRGDTVRIRQNDDVIEKLQSTGLFNSVRLEDSLGKGPEDESALTLNVEEKVPGHFKTSLFFETQYGFGASGSAVHSNVAGSMKEIRMGAVLSQNKQGVSAGFGSPLLWGTMLRFDDDARLEWFQDKLPGASVFGGDFQAANTASLSRIFTYWLRGVTSAELEFHSLVVAEPVTGTLSREGQGTLNFLNTAFISFVNQNLNPSRGVRYALTWGNGGPVFEQNDWRLFTRRHNWLEVKSAYYYYLPPWDPFKVAFRLDGGRFFGIGRGNSDRFFLGGTRSVRSYGFHQLCPTQPAPEVGSCPLLQEDLEPAYLLASAELRLSPFDFSFLEPRGAVKYLKPVQVVPFVDYGKVWNLVGDEKFSPTRGFFLSGYGQGTAYGGGLRYPLLGIFNLRLDLAWGRPGGGNWPDAWLVDLAQAF